MDRDLLAILGSGKGTVAPPIEYDPLEDSASWYNTEGAGASSLHQIGIDIYQRTAATQMLISYGERNYLNIATSTVLNYVEAGTATQSFILAVRATDSVDFIGIRTQNNLVEVYQYIAGVGTQLNPGANISAVGKEGAVIGLEANLETIKYSLDGVEYTCSETVDVQFGKVGIVQATSIAADLHIMSGFNIVELGSVVPFNIHVEQLGAGNPDPPPAVDLFPQDNACSLADLNNVGSWTAHGASLAINAGDTPPFSSYSLSVYSYVGGGGQDYSQIIIPTTPGFTYSLSYWTKFISGGLPNPNARAYLWQGCVASPDIDLTAITTWTRSTIEFEATGTLVYIRFWVNADTHDATGDNLLLDRFSIEQVV